MKRASDHEKEKENIPQDAYTYTALWKRRKVKLSMVHDDITESLCDDFGCVGDAVAKILGKENRKDKECTSLTLLILGREKVS